MKPDCNVNYVVVGDRVSIPDRDYGFLKLFAGVFEKHSSELGFQSLIGIMGF